MGIVTRFMRLCKADIHGVMDQLEDKDLLLKQHLRDMELELGRKEARVRRLAASRDQAQREYEKYSREAEKLDQDLAMAIDKDKDEIARLLIKKLKPLAYHCDELNRHIEVMDREIAHFQNCLEEQRLQYEQLQLRSKEHFHKADRDKWEKSISEVIPSVYSREPSEEEIELELLQRKEAARGGEAK
jgi:phage shock protein A